MELAAALAAAVCLALSAGGRSALGPPPPRSRLVREVLVLWQATGQVERLSRPGAHELKLPCGHAEGATDPLTVVIASQAAEADANYRVCTPDEVARLAAASSEELVRFSDALADAALLEEQAPLPVLLPDGRAQAVAARFTTAAGVVCLVPGGVPELAQFLRAALPGDKVTVQGRLLRWEAAPGPRSVLLVDGLEFEDAPKMPGEPPWTVSILWGGAEAAQLSEPGDCPVVLPCSHKAGATEAAVVRLREYRTIDLQVGGHPLTAELADTPEARSWGLQGRVGLGPDEGMLFYFERGLRATFIMKTVSFPIAVAFIDADGVVVAIGKMNPGDQRGVTSPVPVNYALETRQDWFDTHGIAPGAEVLIP